MEVISLQMAHSLGYEPALYTALTRQGLYPVRLDFITKGTTSNTVTCHFTIITTNKKIHLQATKNERWEDFYSSNDNSINFLSEKKGTTFIAHLNETLDGIINWTKTTRI